MLQQSGNQCGLYLKPKNICLIIIPAYSRLLPHNSKKSEKQNKRKCLPTNKERENITYISLEFYSTAKKNEIMEPALKWKQQTL